MSQVEIEGGTLTIKKAIQECLKENKGLLVGRFGTIELESLLAGLFIRSEQSEILERNAGIFPATPESIRLWQSEYTKAVIESDILATGWYAPLQKAEERLLHSLGWAGDSVKLRCFEPYYVDQVYRWTSELDKQDVCVVSSFADSMEKQIKESREKIWKEYHVNSLLPPLTRWHFVKTGYAPVLSQGRATWMDALDTDVSSWYEAVEELEARILATGANIVLLGCGGLAMVLGQRLKAKGKICIVMGGAIQVLFGIRGKRWEHHSIISHFWNDAWVWPSFEETPAGAKEVEGACYW